MRLRRSSCRNFFETRLFVVVSFPLCSHNDTVAPPRSLRPSLPSHRGDYFFLLNKAVAPTSYGSSLPPPQQVCRSFLIESVAVSPSCRLLLPRQAVVASSCMMGPSSFVSLLLPSQQVHRSFLIRSVVPSPLQQSPLPDQVGRSPLRSQIGRSFLIKLVVPSWSSWLQLPFEGDDLWRSSRSSGTSIHGASILPHLAGSAFLIGITAPSSFPLWYLPLPTQVGRSFLIQTVVPSSFRRSLLPNQIGRSCLER